MGQRTINLIHSRPILLKVVELFHCSWLVGAGVRLLKRKMNADIGYGRNASRLQSSSYSRPAHRILQLLQPFMAYPLPNDWTATTGVDEFTAGCLPLESVRTLSNAISEYL